MPIHVVVAQILLLRQIHESGVTSPSGLVSGKRRHSGPIRILTALALDPERLARFEREAKVVASSNHPNIATIHGV